MWIYGWEYLILSPTPARSGGYIDIVVVKIPDILASTTIIVYL